MIQSHARGERGRCQVGQNHPRQVPYPRTTVHLKYQRPREFRTGQTGHYCSPEIALGLPERGNFQSGSKLCRIRKVSDGTHRQKTPKNCTPKNFNL